MFGTNSGKYAILVLTAFVSTVFAGEKRIPVFQQRRSKDIFKIITALSGRMMGERHYKKGLKLLGKAKGEEKAWLAACLAQYHRGLGHSPVEGIKLLAPVVLPKKIAQQWLRNLKIAESARKQQWLKEKAAALRKRAEPPEIPTGLAEAFPSVKVLNLTANTAPAVLELSKCLAMTGKVKEALQAIDRCARFFNEDEPFGLLQAYESLADIQLMVNEYDKAKQGYQTSLKIFNQIKKRAQEYGDPLTFSKWEKLVKARIEKKLADVNRLMDIAKYGKGYVDYRDAEIQRRKYKNWIKAIELYNGILQNHPRTVYSEAAKCYKIKCLLEQAKLRKPRRGQNKAVLALEKRMNNEKNRYRQARRVKVPQAELDRIKNDMTTIEAEIKTIESAPYGHIAEKQAKKIARDAVAENIWGLYRGEMLTTIGDSVLEFEFDEKGSKKYYDQANDWFEHVKKAEATIKAYQIPGKAVEVSAPPKTMKSKDVWGNVDWSKSDVGDLVNRKSCKWYMDYYLVHCACKRAFLLFLLGDKKTAISLLDVILKLDKSERQLYKKGWPNTYSRLKAEFEQDRLFATTEDLKHFKGKLRTAIMVADFYYEIEQWDEAARRYREFDSKWGSKLDLTARAYLDLMLGYTANTTKRRNEAWKYFKKFETNKRYERTPSWPRAMFTLFTMYQSEPKTRKKGLRCLQLVAKKRKGTAIGDRAYYHQGEFYFAFGHYDKAKTVFLNCQDKFKGTWLARGAGQYLSKIEEKK